MTRINPAHVNPPRDVTPEEAERNKSDMTTDEAARRRREDEGEGIPGGQKKTVDSPTPMPPD